MITKFKLYVLETRWSIRKGKFIGKGGFGEVFEVIGEPDKVIKITTDKTEYESAKKLIGVDNKYLVNYYVSEPHEDSYLLIMDKVNTRLDGNINNILDEINIYCVETDEDFYQETLFNGEELEFFIDDFSDEYDKDDVEFVIDNLKHIVKECQDNDIYTNDFHSGNIGQKNEHLVFFDIGVTK